MRLNIIKSFTSTVLTLVIFVAGGATSTGFATQAKSKPRYTPRYNTIAHKILKLESEVAPVNASMYRFLDTIIDDAKTKVPRPVFSEDHIVRRRQVESILLAIDDILIRHNVIYPRNRKEDWTLLLSDGLTPTSLKKADLKVILAQEHNQRRLNRINRQKPFFLLDCDTASYLYLAIGEVLNLPLSMVDLPEHNFIRWSFSSDNYLNWETMYGRFRSDWEFRMFLGSDELAEDLYRRRVYLVAMSPEDVIGYCVAARALKWERLKHSARAIQDYQTSIEMYPRTPFAFNNLAWLLATHPEANFRNGPKAVELAEKAVLIHADHPNYLDTLAAAYAETGNFEKAVMTETKAYSLETDPETKELYQDLIDAYRQRKTYVQFDAEQAKIESAQKKPR